RRHRAGRAAEAVQQHDGRAAAAAAEGVAMDAVAGELRGPAVGALGEQRRVAEIVPHPERPVRHGAERELLQPAALALKQLKCGVANHWRFSGDALRASSGPPGIGAGVCPLPSGAPWPGPTMNGRYFASSK